MRNFRNLEVWKMGLDLVSEVYKLSRLFPDTEKYGLTSQVQRASISIPSNIAEGCSRNSQVEFKRFLEIAIGSSFELETQVLVSCSLGFISEDQRDKICTDIHLLQRKINALIKTVKTG